MLESFEMKWIAIEISVIFLNLYCCVEVHFETSENGFFLKHSHSPAIASDNSNASSGLTNAETTQHSNNFVLSVDRFTVLQSSHAISIRASYGPFSTKQTVPARFIVPDDKENRGKYIYSSTDALIELQQASLDISAHLVRVNIPQDSPVLRVLFHVGADPIAHIQRQTLCVLLHVSMGKENPLKGRCMPEGEDGVCVAEVLVPSNWWPSFTYLNKESDLQAPQKLPQRWVKVAYSVFEPPSRNSEQCEPKVQIQPLTAFAQVPLMGASFPFKRVRLDEHLILLIPQQPTYPMSKIHLLVLLLLNTHKQISVFSLRARVKSGLKILGAASSTDQWNISYEAENQKQTVARVSAFKIKKHLKDEPTSDINIENGAICVFSWSLEITNASNESLDVGKIVWSANYGFDGSKNEDDGFKHSYKSEEPRKKIVLKLDINKDDIQAVLPMAKSWELLNTAVLTGRQVSLAMKVYIVSQAGKVADVTLQSSCNADDESVIKVSSSCSSVYVDGSEIRGSSNASIIVKYGTYIGIAKFIVWMPEFPIELKISDLRLSQIKGWRVYDVNSEKHLRRRKKRSYTWGQIALSYKNSFGFEKTICRARFQQSPVDVYARFIAVDQRSGRVSFYISRRTSLRITDLALPLLRIADPKVATLKGRILQGKSVGRTDVQVLSPITGRVIGAKEVRVGSDKVSLNKLLVRVVSGLQLSISPDNSIQNGYVSQTTITNKLTAQYQEGLLDIDLEFSDGTLTPLREIAVEDYFLLVESLDTEVVAFAPMLASHHPRVIAVGEGNGDLLRVTLLLSEGCRVRRSVVMSQQPKNTAPLASALATVQVDFNSDEKNKIDLVQNDGIVEKREKKGRRFIGDLADIIVGISERGMIHLHKPTFEARHGRGNIHSNKILSDISGYSYMTTVEAGLYVLLTGFCIAIIVFVISCVIYSSKFKPVEIQNNINLLQTRKAHFGRKGIFENKFPKEPTANVHDWVWLGRSTLDKSSAVLEKVHEGTSAIHEDPYIRITYNPTFNCDNENIKVTYMNTKQILNELTLKEYIKLNSSRINSVSYDLITPVRPHPGTGRQTTICQAGVHACKNQITEEILGKASSTFLDMENGSNDSVKSDGLCGARQNFKKQKDEKAHSLTSNNRLDAFYLHNAEKLVKNYNSTNKNVFQFDSLASNDISCQKEEQASNDENPFNQHQLNIKLKRNEISTDNAKYCAQSNGGRSLSRCDRVKHSTIIANEFYFSSSNVPAECLGLKDLHMNYEDIMQFFHNLKESDA